MIHVLSIDSKDDLDIKKQLHKNTAVGNTILRFPFCTREIKAEVVQELLLQACFGGLAAQKYLSLTTSDAWMALGHNQYQVQS